MTLVKTDRPRQIYQIIDYFGDPRHGAPNDPRPDEGVVIRIERIEEARSI